MDELKHKISKRFDNKNPDVRCIEIRLLLSEIRWFSPFMISQYMLIRWEKLWDYNLFRDEFFNELKHLAINLMECRKLNLLLFVRICWSKLVDYDLIKKWSLKVWSRCRKMTDKYVNSGWINQVLRFLLFIFFY